MRRTMLAAFVAGCIMGIAAVMGTLIEALLRFLLQTLGTAPIPADGTGMVAVTIAIFICLTAVTYSMGQ